MTLRSVLCSLIGCFAALVPFSGRADVHLSVRSGYTKLLMHQKHTLPIQIAISGNRTEGSSRAPVNVAIVLDRSGSMSGDKLERAKEAAIMAVDMLGTNDIISVVTYDDSADVVVPATKAQDKEKIRQLIRNIHVAGSTALFAGVSKGAGELRKFLDRNGVHRVVLLSDGIANVGPSSPGELAELGRSLAREGITVSTFGLGDGYNEDLMTQLANASDGNHAFVERSADLARIFRNEFGDLLSVVANGVTVTITCADGVRPIRLLGRNGEIVGQQVTVPLNQLYSDQEKYVVLEVEVDARSWPTVNTRMADARIAYSIPNSSSKSEQSATVYAMGVSDKQEMETSADKKALEAYYTQVAGELNARAVVLRDEGKTEEARETLGRGAAVLNENAAKYSIPELKKRAGDYEEQASGITSQDWNVQRKAMKEYDYKNRTQQKW